MILFLAGLWIALAQKRIFGIERMRALFFYAWHTVFCLLYFLYTLGNPADAKTYYLSSLSDGLSFDVGTRGIHFLTSLFSVVLGLSYGGAFLLYNVIGFVGMLALAAALEEVTCNAGVLARRFAFLLMLLPGLSFWSSAIGKDSLTFLAAGLVTWGALNIGNRYPSFVISILSCQLARPHIAAILLVSLVMALLFASRIDVFKKLFVVLVLIPLAVSAVSFGSQYTGLGDAMSPVSIGDYLAQRQEYNLEGSSSIDIASMPLVMRLFSYLYRPLFLDANGLNGLIVSLENLVLCLFCFLAFVVFIRGRRPSLPLFTSIFFVIYIVVSLFLLANSTANLGIAIRQKWMILPMLLVLCMSIVFKPRRS